MDSWEDQVRRFMLDEEEVDDELFLVMVPALQLCMYDEKMPEHTSSLSCYANMLITSSILVS